jgi:hypothetical protein
MKVKLTTLTVTLSRAAVLQLRGCNLCYLDKQDDGGTVFAVNPQPDVVVKHHRKDPKTGLPETEGVILDGVTIAIQIGDAITTSHGTGLIRVKRGTSARPTFKVSAPEHDRITVVRRGQPVGGRAKELENQL